MTNQIQKTASSTWPSPLRSWYLIAVLWLAYVSSFMDRLILSMLVDPIKKDLMISDTQISLLIGLSFALFYTLLGLPIARLADSYNRKRIIIAGILLWSVMTAISGLARSYAMLFAARVGVAVGEATLHPSALSMISDHFPVERKSLPISVYLTASFAGISIAFLVGGFVISSADQWISSFSFLEGFNGWQITFFVAALPGLIAAALLLPVREPVRQERHSESSKPLPLATVFKLMQTDMRSYVTIIGGPLAICIYVFALLSWFPSLMIREHGLSAAEAGTMIGIAFLIAGPIGTVGSSWIGQLLVRRGQENGMMIAAIACAFLSFIPGVAVAVADNSNTAALMFTLFILFGSGMTTIPQAALQILAPNEIRAQVAAIWNFFVNLIGFGLGPTIVAVLSDNMSPDGSELGRSLAIVGTISLLSGIVILMQGLKATKNSFSGRLAGA